MEIENRDPRDPLVECGARWRSLNAACVEHAEALARHGKELNSLRQVESDRHQTELARVVSQRDNAINQCERDLKNALEQIQSEAQSQRRDIEDQARVRREEIENTFDSNSKSAKQHLEEAIWLAESVLETGEAAPRVEFEAARTRISQVQITLNESFDAACAQLKRYRQSQPAPTALDQQPTPDSCEGILVTQAALSMDSLMRLRKLRLAGMFRGPILLVPSILLTGTVVGIAALAGIRGWELATTTGAGVLLSGVGIVLLWFLARKEVLRAWMPMSQSYQLGLAACAMAMKSALDRRNSTTSTAVAKRDREIRTAKTKWGPVLDELQAQSRADLESVQRTRKQRSGDLEGSMDRLMRSAQELANSTRHQASADAANSEDLERRTHKENIARLDSLEQDHARDRRGLWIRERDSFGLWVDSMVQKSKLLMPPWETAPGSSDLPPHFSEGMAFGELALDLSKNPHGTPKERDCAWPHQADGEPLWRLAALRPLPNAPSLLVETPLQGRSKGLEMVQSAALRLLTQAPPGKVRFYFFDPVGLGQSFAGFMHLADEMDSLVSEKIWSEPRQIEQKLTDLTEYVETVIQKYLRNEFATIAQYNEQAGELAEPLRVVVFADFPEGLTDAASKRFSSLLQSGGRCGVHFLLHRDSSKPLPDGIREDEVLQCCKRVRWIQDRFALDIPGLEDVPFTPGAMPAAMELQGMLQRVARAAKSVARVEVPFRTIEPKMDQRWTSSCAKILRVPVGRSGANKLLSIEIGEGTRQHVLLAGKTGSGKSTLLHALITNVALWYSPDEVELWLIDFKKGVEFKAYATHGLPHARAVAVESDREFGLSVLQGLDAELKRRGDLFRAAGVQDLAAWRSLGKKEAMPRTLLIVDEFQELFVEEDKVAQDSSLLLDRLVRQGRAFGMHVILGSQTLGGTYALPRTTMGQMGIRIALQCNEADAAMILSDDNTAARLLSRPGEAIYNDAGGLIEGNNPFQVVWLTDAQRNDRVAAMAESARAVGVAKRKMIVFDGTASARIELCEPLRHLIANPPGKAALALQFFVGDPVAIRNASVITLRRQSGANIIVIGQREEVAMGLSVAALASFNAIARKNGGKLILLDGTTPDSHTAGVLPGAIQRLKLEAEVPSYRDSDDSIVQLGVEVARRVAQGRQDSPPILLMIHGLQRFRGLRKDEDDFSSLGDGPPKPDKVLGAILRDGPGVGVHVYAWADTAPSLQRCIDRNALREFDFRVLMQMSANDSSYLMDTPAASRLGADRALIFSEEKGTIERFRPFEIAEDQVLGELFK